MKEPVYEVFARKNRDEPLRHIGYINALNGELARVCAWKTYDEQNWFEMCVVPRAAILPVNLREGPFADGGRPAADAVVHAAGTGAYGGAEVV
jgi:1,2-phenylacetyl-CoA epoxidase PaaB subunit